MPETHKSSKSLKYLTIAAIVLLVIVVLPYAVIEKARRDADRNAAEVHFRLDHVQFNSDDYVQLHFQATPDSPLLYEAADWSLSQWKVTCLYSTFEVFTELREPDTSLLEGFTADFPHADEENVPLDPPDLPKSQNPMTRLH